MYNQAIGVVAVTKERDLDPLPSCRKSELSLEGLENKVVTRLLRMPTTMVPETEDGIEKTLTSLLQ